MGGEKTRRARRLAGAAIVLALLGALAGARVSAAPTPGARLARPIVPARFSKLDARLRAVAASRARDGLMAARATARAVSIEPTSEGVVVIVEPSAGMAAA